ncbi:GDP-mannose:glycolipid 4-beta-D-mannosyltransferase [Tersicoccus solisilvae]|uniref:GDP-mannose:glycolipid 4-beta-D-mannosyltransferase n=1 Tax=Tersicoccus solisilvae TaxID=1882339 RepID=A0ABQ1PNR8_9MICC|nr:glycosyltransferase [Tersicoccus solisilvae]GGD00086.1 GDP-mannose:glycolipid 4-beta-D-mannosyltransferase [Tersicoccus solisilvae]
MSGPLVVMESLQRVGPQTNPYLRQLVTALERDAELRVELFTWRRALTGRVDVFHVHWPEQMVGGHRRVGRLVRRCLTALVVARFALARVPVVRTVHNLHRPAGLARVDHALLAALDRLTVVAIRLNDATPTTQAAVTIPHGHYRDWFAPYPAAERVGRRAAYVGLIRRYKGVERLVEQFRQVDDPAATLVVAGRPSSDALQAEIAALAGDDRRITTRFAFLEDAELVATITASSLVVLPYRHMHNSGTVLAALSLDRPVLVPDNEVNRALADEVGPGWVHTYAGELTAADIARALAAPAPQHDRPDLTAREWSGTAAAHARAFRDAVARRRRARR